MSTRALQTQLTAEVNKHIKKDNSFYTVGRNDNASSKDIVEVNESATLPSIIKNPKQFPLKAYTSEDVVTSYKNHTLASAPVLITVDNELLTKFNKRANEMEKHGDQIENFTAETINFEWAAVLATQQIRTDGGSTGTVMGAMTGTRLAVTRSNFIQAHRILTQNGCPTRGRIMLIDIAQYYELLTVAGLTEAQLTGLTDPIFLNGTLAPIMGVTKVFLRDRVTWYDNSSTPLRQEGVSEGTEHDEMVENAPVAATNLAIHIFHPNYVRYSYGNARANIESGSPLYNGGTILNSTVRAGAAKVRIDEKGIVAIVQGN